MGIIKRYFIGQGDEAQEIINRVFDKRDEWRGTIEEIEREFSMKGFVGVWDKGRGNVMSGYDGIQGPFSDRKLTKDEEAELGVKYVDCERKFDDKGFEPISVSYMYAPRLNTKKGKEMKAMLDEKNKMAFSPHRYIIDELKCFRFYGSGGKLYHSSAGIVNETLLVVIPHGSGRDEIMGKEDFPILPEWMREVKESEFLAFQGK